MGFVDQTKVTVQEFEAALRLLIPPDGSAPRLGSASDEMPLATVFGGAAQVSRLKPFQRQRASRLCQRMVNFGYSPEAVSILARALFLTKLHDKDLWSIWRLVHPRGSSTEVPLERSQAHHLLALLAEERDVDQVLEMLDKAR